MLTIRKRLTAALLAAALLVLPVSVRAADDSGTCGADGDNVTWSLDTGTGVLTVGGTGAMADYEGPADAPWDACRSAVRSVTVGSGVTRIGAFAFSDCESLAEVTIPDSVTQIGIYAFLNTDIVRCTIPDGVTCIESGTFRDCEKLVRIVIPDSVTEIDGSAFENCKRLRSVTIPDGVTRIGGSAFYSTGLVNVTIPDSVTSIGQYAFDGTDFMLHDDEWTDGVLYAGPYLIAAKRTLSGACRIADGTRCIAAGAFSGCAGMTDVAIPDSVTTIGYYAFNRCKGLTHVTIPDGVTQIESGVFEGCTRLAGVTIPDGVTEIGNYVFYGCKSLACITVPDSVTRIGYQTFTDCAALADVYYTADAAAWEQIEIGGGNDLLTAAALHTSHTHAFRTVVTAPACTAGGHTAYTCTVCGNVYTADKTPAAGHDFGAWEVTTPSTADTVGTQTRVCARCGYTETRPVSALFSGACGAHGDNVTWSLDTATGELTVDGTGETADYAYFNHAPWYDLRAYIRSVTVEDGVTHIGSYAFCDCGKIACITIPGSVTTVGDYAFNCCNALRSVYFTGSLAQWCGMQHAELDFPHALYVDGSLLEEAVIPDGVTSIGDHAFRYCTSLVRVTLPDSVTSIGRCAFYASNLASITLPDSMTSIGDSAFGYCTGLVEVTIPDSVTHIGASAFYDCKCLVDAAIPDGVTYIGSGAFCSTGITHVTIPDGVMQIESGTFRYCTNLAGVTIPDSVTEIGCAAFFECESLMRITIPESVTNIQNEAFFGAYLADVYYTADAAAWEQIEIGEENESLLYAELHTSHTHAFRTVVTAPACIAGGHTAYTCTVCGNVYTADKTPAAGHSFGAWEVTTPATADTAGEETRVCTRCGCSETRPTARHLPGDCDGDGTVDLGDVAALSRCIAGGWDVEVGTQNADVNGDGLLSLRDVVLIRRYLAGGWDVILL